MTSNDPLERMDELRLAREDLPSAVLVAELEAMSPLPPETSAMWDAESTWDQAYLLVVLIDLIAERKLAEAVPVALRRMCLGDPGETMRSLPDALACALVDSGAAAELFVRTLADPQAHAGGRWWAAQSLASLGGPDELVAVHAACSDVEPMVAEAAVNTMGSMAQRNPRLRQLVRRHLADFASHRSSALKLAANRNLADLDAVEAAEAVEAVALAAAERGDPYKTVITVRRCGGRTTSNCPKHWSELTPTSTDSTRCCSVCLRAVHLCSSDEETVDRAASNDLVARVEPHPDELPGMVLWGPHAKPPALRERQARALAWQARERGVEQAIRTVDRRERRCPGCSYPVHSFRKTCYVCGFEIGRG